MKTSKLFWLVSAIVMTQASEELFLDKMGDNTEIFSTSEAPAKSSDTSAKKPAASTTTKPAATTTTKPAADTSKPAATSTTTSNTTKTAAKPASSTTTAPAASEFNKNKINLFTTEHIIGTILMMILITLSNAGGLSGAGSNIPIMLIFFDMGMAEAVPISAFVAVCATVFRFMLNFN